MKVRNVTIFRSRVATYAILVILAALLWKLAEKGPRSGEAGDGALPPSPPTTIRKDELPPGLKEDLSADYLQGYAASGSDPARDLVLVKDVLNAFSYSIKIPEALPTAGNREIVAALLGDNPYKIRFLAPDFAFLSRDGELLDRWNTPLYFHFEEATDPGLRSAGPDRTMWTADDVVLEE